MGIRKLASTDGVLPLASVSETVDRGLRISFAEGINIRA